MEIEELKSELKKIVAGGVKKRDIESASGLGKNSLTGIMNGYKPVGKIRFQRLEQYVIEAKKKKIIVTQGEDGILADSDGNKYIIGKDQEIEKLTPGLSYASNLSELVALKVELKAAKEEKIPKERDTVTGRVVWAKDQQKKIEHIIHQIISKIP